MNMIHTKKEKETSKLNLYFVFFLFIIIVYA